MTENAPKGARRFAPRPFGSVEGHENGFKRSKKGPEKVWGPFFDIFLTSCRSPAGPQDLFLTFFGPFVGDPQKSAPGHFWDIFRRIQETPICSDLAHCKHMATGRLSFCPEVGISGHQSPKSEPPFQKSKPTSRLLTSPHLTSRHLTSPPPP